MTKPWLEIIPEREVKAVMRWADKSGVRFGASRNRRKK